MKKSHLLTFILLFFTLSLISQSIERQLIGVAGDNESGNQIILDWTIGEPFIAYDNTLLGDYKEGFLQLDGLNQQLAENTNEMNQMSSVYFSANVFPNPFKGAFTFEVNHAQELNAQLSILDYSGKVLITKIFPAGIVKMELTLGDYPPGLYFLQFKDDSGFLKTSFKLLKL